MKVSLSGVFSPLLLRLCSERDGSVVAAVEAV